MVSLWIFAFLVTVCSASQDSRIIGGQIADIEQYPSVVQVESSSGLIWGQSCGGTILTTRYVMSAAQCFSGILFSPSRRRIRAGSNRRNRGGVVIGVDRALNHPNYVSSSSESDLSIVRLSSALIYSPKIYRASIVSQNFNLPNYLPITEVGWGSTRASGSGTSNNLREVTVYTVSKEFCAERFADLPSPRTLSANMLCSGLVDGQGACAGDEGGPVFYDDIVVGVISWNHGCGNSTIPNINTRVASFTNWIVINAS